MRSNDSERIGKAGASRPVKQPDFENDVDFHGNDRDFRHLEDAFEQNPVASANEWTGLAPRIPDSDGEADSLGEMLDVPVTVCKNSRHTPTRRK